MAKLAERQHGVVARRQLVELGFGRGAIATRLAQGRLHPVHRGAYAVGHRHLDARGRWMAAVLAVGPGSVLSHRSAGALWGVTETSRPAVDVTGSGAGGRHSRPGIDLHRAALGPNEITVHGGIPVTTVPRTLLDLSSVLPFPRLQRAVDRAEALRLSDPLSLQDVIDRHSRNRGTAAIRRILTDHPSPAITRSELENRFLDFLHAHDLPRPRVNAGVDIDGRWLECDFVWKGPRVIVELDGRTTHDTAAAFERDRARDRALQAAGWRVVRITWRQLHEEPERIAADLRTLLDRI